jgi:D-alanyl-D-alanine carboxypeptidase
MKNRLCLSALSGMITVLTTLSAHAGPLQAFLDRFIEKEDLPGAVLLVSGPQGRQVVASGVARRKPREDMTPDTRFYIASSGKLTTATAALQLVKEGKLSLEEPVWPRLEDVPGLAKLRNIQSVTLDQLLKHRTGLAEYYTDDFEAKARRKPDKRFSAAESLAFAYGERPQGKPGRQHEYTNTNYVLLSELVERTDRQTFERALQQRIFGPAGMSHSSVGARKTEKGLAHGYSYDDEGRLRDISASGWSAITGDGPIVTTAADYEAFLFALFRDGKLLPKALVAHMCTPQAEEPDSEYGLGCQVMDTPWGQAWGHNGSVPGFNADTWYIPKLGIAVVFMTNGDPDSDDPDIVVRAVKAYLKK